MALTITNILLLFTSGLGFFLSLLIFHKYGYSLANRLLALLLFLYGVVLLRLLLWDLEYYRLIPHVLLMPVAISFLMGPVHYLYAKYLINSENKFIKRDFIHFVPFLIFQVFLFKDFFKSGEELIKAFTVIENESLSGEFVLFNWIITVHVLFYVALTLLKIHRYSLSLKYVFSSIEKLQLDWLWYITIFIGAGMVVFLLENTFLLGGFIISELFALSNVIFCLYVLAIGYLGLLKSEIFLSKEFSDSVHDMPGISESLTDKEETRYKKSGLSEERAEEIMNALLELMDAEAPYADSGLTLNKLADKLEISPHNLSEVINTKLNQSFFDFVNKYRIEKVKRDLTDSKKKHLTLLALANDAGFNSKSSFNSIFKKVSGVTPTEYRKSQISGSK